MFKCSGCEKGCCENGWTGCPTEVTDDLSAREWAESQEQIPDWDPAEEVSKNFWREERQDMRSFNEDEDLSASIAERISAAEAAEVEEEENEYEDPGEQYENALQEEGPTKALTVHEIQIKILSAGIALGLEYDDGQMLYHRVLAKWYQRKGNVQSLLQVLTVADLADVMDHVWVDGDAMIGYIDDEDCRTRRVWNVGDDCIDVMKYNGNHNWIVEDKIKF